MQRQMSVSTSVDGRLPGGPGSVVARSNSLQAPSTPRRLSRTPSDSSISKPITPNHDTSGVFYSTQLVTQLASKLESSMSSADFAIQALAQCKAQEKTLMETSNFEDQQIARLMLELNSLRGETAQIKSQMKRARVAQATELTLQIENEKRLIEELRDNIAKAKRDFEDCVTEKFVIEQEIRLHDPDDSRHQLGYRPLGHVTSSNQLLSSMDTDLNASSHIMQVTALSDDRVYDSFLGVKPTRRITQDAYLHSAEHIPDADGRTLRTLGDYMRGASTPSPAVYPSSPSPSTVLRLPPISSAPIRSRSSLL